MQCDLDIAIFKLVILVANTEIEDLNALSKTPLKKMLVQQASWRKPSPRAAFVGRDQSVKS